MASRNFEDLRRQKQEENKKIKKMVNVIEIVFHNVSFAGVYKDILRNLCVNG